MAKFLLKNTFVLKLIKKTLKETEEGCILFEQDDEWRKLFFKNRKITGSSSSNRSDGYLQYLIYYDVVSNDQLEEALRTGFDSKKVIDSTLDSIPPETLKEIVFEKIIDTLFLVAKWPECKYSVVKCNVPDDQIANLELSAKEVAAGLKKNIAEFRSILKSIPKLGAVPRIDKNKLASYNVSGQEEIILDNISAGKTIDEVLSVMYAHSYILLKCFYRLSLKGILTAGIGAPLSKEDIVTLVSDSKKLKISSQLISTDFILSTLLEENVFIEKGKVKSNNKSFTFHDIDDDDDEPENTVFSYCFNKAETSFIANFYSKKLSPFAVIKVASDFLKKIDTNEIDEEIYEVLKKEGGQASLRNIIRSMEHRSEIDTLFSIDKLLSKGFIKDVEPQTFIDAIKLGGNEHLKKLFNKNEKNKLFATDISQNLTSSMLSVISGEKSDGNENEVEEKKSEVKAKAVLHDYEMTPLMLASMIGNYDAAEFLLLNNADPNLHNGNGVTALMLSLQNGYDDIAWLLIDYGADVDAKNTKGYSALMIASSKGMTHIVDRMIKLGVDINHVNSNGQTALNSAVRFNHEDVAVSLIAAGIDLDISDSEGYSPLYYAETVAMSELIEKGAGNSKRIKRNREKKKKESRAYDRNLLKDKKEVVPGSFPVFIFSTILFITSYINVSLFFFSGESYGLTSGSKRVMEQLGDEYCERFKICRDNIPPHVLSKCSKMGFEVMSDYFKHAKSCNDELVKECMSCIRSISCDNLYQINGSNLSEYCYQCISICEYKEI